MHHRKLLPLVAILFVAACGGGASSGQQSPPAPGTDGHNPPSAVSLSVAPAVAELTAGGAPLALTATLSSSTAAISWTVEGPGNLSSTGGPTVSYLPPPALAADAVATVTASAGGVSATATVTVRPLRIRVAGQVIGVLGNPAPGVTVTIGERSAVTDQAGRFSLDDVSRPYSLTAFSVASNEAMVYQGLTRVDPTILWRRPVELPERRAQVAGTVDGGVPPSTSGSRTVVVFSSPEASTQAETLGPDYEVPLNWRGPTATTGSVHVLQITSPAPGALPTSFPGYGLHTEVTALDGVTTPAVDVTLTTPAVSSVRGTYTVPPGYAFFSKFLALRFLDGAFMSIGFDDGLDPGFSYLVPDEIGARVEVIAQASGPGASVLRRQTGISPGTIDLDLVLPLGAPSLSPTDGTQGVDAETEFAWGPFPRGVFAVDFVAPGHGPTFHVVTSDTRTTLPRVPALPVPGATQYAWTVTAAAPFSSVDDAAGPRPFEPEGTTLFKSFGDTLGFVTR